MANREDVIELGSSDDEPDPAPIKHKLLPNPNAMVSIPSLSGLTIKPINAPPTQKHRQPQVNINKTVMIAKKSTAHTNLNGRDIHRIPVAPKQIIPIKKNISTCGNTVVKIPKLPRDVQLIKTKGGIARLPATNPHRDNKQMLTPKISNVSSLMNCVQKPPVSLSRSIIQIQRPHTVSSQKVNPLNIMANKSIARIPSNVQVMARSKILPQTPLPSLNEVMEKVKKHLGQQCLSSLPPEITVKRTKGQAKRPAAAVSISAKRPRLQENPKPQIGLNVGDVLTVELDDDEDSSNVNNQWYIRPEEANISNEANSESAGNTKTFEEAQRSEDVLIVTLEPCLDLNTQDIENMDSKKEEVVLLEDNKEQSMVIELEKCKNNVEMEKENNECNDLSKEEKEIHAVPDNTNPKPIEIINEMESNNIATPKKIIEITIEDSPVKPIVHRRASQISSDLAIEIEDSPIKETEAKNNDKLPNISEENEEINTAETPKSKKKLNFSKLNKNPSESHKEIEHMSTTSKLANDPLVSINNSKLREPIKLTSTDVTEVAENTLLNVHSPKPSTSKTEFTDIYQSFIDLCLKIENSDDMRKIIEKKVKNYYRQVDKSFTESEEFLDLVSSKVCEMKVNPENLYLFIRDVVDELNAQRKMAKNKTTDVPAAVEEEATIEQEDPKVNRNVRKLEKTLRKLHRAIQKLEEQEVDFDDDADSVYLLTESEDETPARDANTPPKRDRETLLKRYKERLVKVHAKLCQLTRTKMPSEAKISLEVRPGMPKGPVQRLEKYINKKVPAGAPLPFPDFHDVLRCVREANAEDNLGWSEMEIQDEARELFMRCGKKLQKRRQQNEWRAAAARLQAEPEDPAAVDADLKRKLDANKQLAAKREADVINKYVTKQNDLKLEAKEINDKEAEESPASEDDDCQEVEYVEAKVRTPEKNSSLIVDISFSPEKISRSSEAVCESTFDIEWKDEVNNKNSQGSSKEVSVDSKKEPTKEHSTSSIPEKEMVEDNKIETISVETEDSKDSKTNKTSEKSDSESNNIVISGESSSQRVDTDIDELHLLKSTKNINCSTLMNSSDSDEQATITDSNESNPKEENVITSSDVVSIENSSDIEFEHDTGTSSTQPLACTTDSESNEQIKTKIDCISLGPGELIIAAQNKGSENEENNLGKDSITNERYASVEDHTSNTTEKDHEKSLISQNFNDVVFQEETGIETDECDDIRSLSSQNSPLQGSSANEITEDNIDPSSSSHYAAIDNKTDEDTTMSTERDYEMIASIEIEVSDFIEPAIID